MTTIAFKNGMLAADTGCLVHDTCGGFIEKIVRGRRGTLGGAAGNGGYCHAFRDWLSKGEKGRPPEPQEAERVLDRGIIFRRGCDWIEIHEPGGVTRLRAPYFAIGSGSELAMGRMSAPHESARDGVAAAIEHDPYTFGDITVLTF